MEQLPSFVEEYISQVSALQLLQNLGYFYLRPQEVFLERRGRLSNLLLETILEKQLRKLNSITFKGQQHEFSDENIQAAIQVLRDVPFDGLIRTSEKIYELLILGKSFQQTIAGDTKSFTLNFIDWESPENNVFHVAAELEVEQEVRTKRSQPSRPDIVLFVNGIPLAVIECQGPEGSIELPISQHLRNQDSSAIPRLFVYSQLLVAIKRDEAKYATTGTESACWSHWHELTDITEEVGQLINQPLTREQKDRLFADLFAPIRNNFEEWELDERTITEQDRAIYSLCRPRWLIELASQFIIFAQGKKKIALYHQYNAIKKTLDRVKRTSADGKRPGGIIWHSTGISMTMAMIARAIWRELIISDPQLLKTVRILIVTDRDRLEDQIVSAFKICGKEMPEVADVVQAKTGRHLLELLSQNNGAIITTATDKFEAAFKTQGLQNPSNDIFVLVDEVHRGRFPEAYARMRKALPNACYIGLSRTPLKKREKQIAANFDGIIDTYTLDQAVKDKAIVPVLYETRHTAKTSEYESDRRIPLVARDISRHFTESVERPFKAQLVTGSKAAALKYKQYLDQLGLVSSGMETLRRDNEPDLIIAVDKLLRGSDVSHNMVIYLDTRLEGHALLQTIAAVNRPRKGKDFGFVVDYCGALDEISEFDREDLGIALTPISEEAAKLPGRHSELWECFREIRNGKDVEAFERSLADKEARERFYAKFSAFNRTLSIAFSSLDFINETPRGLLERYRRDLADFQRLRIAVKRRYADEIDFPEYEARLQKLINAQVSSTIDLQVTPLLRIFDRERFQAEVDDLESTASKADTIAHRTRGVISGSLDEIFYRRLLRSLEEVIRAWRDQRISDAEYLNEAVKIMTAVRDRIGDDLPAELENRESARRFYGTVNEVFSRWKDLLPDSKKAAAKAALKIDRIIQENMTADRSSNRDVQNQVKNQIEDYLYALKEAYGIDLTHADLDLILDKSIEIAIDRC
jgi:type I restriction enzyme, R subunit